MRGNDDVAFPVKAKVYGSHSYMHTLSPNNQLQRTAFRRR